MARNLPAAMVTEITGAALEPAVLVDLQITSGTVHVWSGIGSLAWNGNTYSGLGSLGAISGVSESTGPRADGLMLQLSGIDPTLLNDTLADIQPLAPATVWFAVMGAGAVQAVYQLFSGTVDRPTVDIGPTALTIQIALESRMTNLQRSTMRRYTTADQRMYYPTDTGFAWVEILNDIALLWG